MSPSKFYKEKSTTRKSNSSLTEASDKKVRVTVDDIIIEYVERSYSNLKRI